MKRIIKTGTGIEKTGTGIVAGHSSIERTGTGIEKTGTGIEKTGTGIRRLGLLAALVFAFLLTSAAQAETRVLNGLTITTHADQVAVSWHRTTESGIEIVSGFAPMTDGFALLDLTVTGKAPGEAFNWGTAEINVSKGGRVDGTLNPFAGADVIFEISDGNSYMISAESAFEKVQGGGTGN
jgi:hypothetical protein